jgi:hypothetical protein
VQDPVPAGGRRAVFSFRSLWALVGSLGKGSGWGDQGRLFHARAPRLGGDFPGRRKSVPGGCGKNIALRSPCCAQARGGPPWPPARRMRRALFFTPRKIPSQSRHLVIALVLHEIRASPRTARAGPRRVRRWRAAIDREWPPSVRLEAAPAPGFSRTGPDPGSADCCRDYERRRRAFCRR